MKTKTYSLLVLLSLLILSGCATTIGVSSEVTTTGSTTQNNEMNEKIINTVEVITEDLLAYEKIEIALYEEVPKIKSLGNPYDYEYLKIVGKFTSPTGEIVEVPAFWYQDYEISLDTTYTGTPNGIQGTPSRNTDEPQGLEKIDWNGDEHYRIRFLPEEIGTYEYQINITKNGELAQVLTGNFIVNQNEINYKGRIQIEPTHKRNFIFQDGSTYIPIGQNTAWYTSSTRKTYDYDVWFENMSENGANAARIWLATWGFSLHWGDDYNDFSSRMTEAAQLDRVIGLAEENDIYLMLTLINHGQFSKTVNAEWERNPWNVNNGGILNQPMEFFWKKSAKDAYKSQLLYIIGRWGYSNHIMTWELWNEVNWVDNYQNSPDGYMWHKEMSQFIKDNDPYHHLVSTSFNNDKNNTYNISTIDYTNPHSYGYTDKNFNSTLPWSLESIWNTYQKPVFHSEIGINWESGTANGMVDPEGISIHQQNWAGMMGGGAGGAMNWWWDSFVHPKNLYYRFKGASTYAKEMDMVGESYQLLMNDDEIMISDNLIDVLGYRIDERIYAYFYHKDWKYTNPNVSMKENVNVELPFTNGDFTLRVFDTVTGSVIKTENIQVSNNIVSITFENIQNDIAIVID